MLYFKATRIVECLKEIKKQNNPDYSKISADLIAKWKTQLSAQPVNEPLPVNNVSSSNGDTTSEKKQASKMSINDYKSKKGSDMTVNSMREEIKTREAVKPTPTTAVKQPTTRRNSNSIMPLPTMPLTNILDPNELYNSNRPTSKSTMPETHSSYVKANQQQPVSKSNNRMLSDDEALTKIFSSKHSKQRLLYTGRKHVDTHVPKLFDLCTRTLIDNIDDFPTRIYEYSE